MVKIYSNILISSYKDNNISVLGNIKEIKEVDKAILT